MEVFINHSPVETDAATTLAELLMQEGIAADGIAVAIANKVVPAASGRRPACRPERKSLSYAPCAEDDAYHRHHRHVVRRIGSGVDSDSARKRVDRVHLRKPQSAEADMRRLIEALPPELYPRLTLQDHLHLAGEYGIGGVHLNARNPEIPAGFGD